MAVAQKVRSVVDAIVAHGDRVYTVTLRPERAVPRFRAGQFLHLALDPYDPTGFWPDSRAFSIASSPADPRGLRITYSVHGQFTSRMENELGEGREVWIKMPYGDFVVDRRRDAVLIAGGTGITAFSAFLEDLSASREASVTLAYGARTNRLLIYRDVVEQCARRARALDVMYFAEHGDAGEMSPPVPVAAGRVSVDAIWPRLRRPSNALYYISGPPAMLRSVASDLQARNIAAEAIHIDAWE